MYNYMDFFSNKYKIRKRISDEMKRKVSMTVIKNMNIFNIKFRKLIIY